MRRKMIEKRAIARQVTLPKHTFLKLSVSALPPLSSMMLEKALSYSLQHVLLRLLLYIPISIFVLWILHVIKPALVAALAPEYRDCNWVDGKRGVWSFLKSTWNVAVHSEERFAEIHRKVR